MHKITHIQLEKIPLSWKILHWRCGQRGWLIWCQLCKEGDVDGGGDGDGDIGCDLVLKWFSDWYNWYKRLWKSSKPNISSIKQNMVTAIFANKWAKRCEPLQLWPIYILHLVLQCPKVDSIAVSIFSSLCKIATMSAKSARFRLFCQKLLQQRKKSF